jgi:hypothetical protein
MGEYVLQRMRDANGLVQRAGPYVLIELLLPGGTLLALLLYLCRRNGNGAAAHSSGRRWLCARLESALDLGVAGASSSSGERDGLEPLGLAPAA